MNYIYSVKSVKYGTPTGLATMPASGSMVSLPDTVKGSIDLEEAEGTTQDFFTDQKIDSIKKVKTEEGQFVATFQFYDLDYTMLAAIKGGSGDASGWTPSTGYTLIEKALEIATDSGHVFDFFNASIDSRILGGGGRDAMFMVEMKATPQVTADGLGSYKIRPE